MNYVIVGEYRPAVSLVRCYAGVYQVLWLHVHQRPLFKALASSDLEKKRFKEESAA